MNIAIDIRHLTTKNISGVGHYTLNVINELAKESPETTFTLFATGSKKTLSRLPVFHQKNIQVVTKAIPNRVLYALLFLKLITLEKFLSNKPNRWFFPNANIINTKLPYAITIHDISFDFMPDVFSRKQRLWHKIANPKRLAKGAKVILSVSESTKQDLEERWSIDESKIFVTPLGVSSKFKPKEQPHDKNFLRLHKIDFPYFLTLSTLEPRKNIESVIEAYDIWRNSIDSSHKLPHLVIAGGKGWKTKTIEKLIKSSH